MIHKQIKRIGHNRGNARLWFESQLLNEVGLTPGTRFFANYTALSETLVLSPDPSGNRTVSKKAKGAKLIPVVDICHTATLGALAEEETVLAVFDTDKKTLTITKT